MAVYRYRALATWKLTEAFKLEVFRLIRTHPAARKNFDFSGQLIKSARAPSKDIAEGFERRSAPTFALYLTYALASLAEANEHLIDGIQLGYFPEDECRKALDLALRCLNAAEKLRDAQYRYVGGKPPARPPSRPRRRNYGRRGHAPD